MTFFDKMQRSFADVPVDAEQKISTSEFLEASESLVKLFDLFNSAAFAVVQNDMNGNISKLRTRLLASPEKSATLQDLVVNERAEKKKTASEGLLWLTRGLQFTAVALRETLEHPESEMTKTFTDAYGKSLSKYHSFVVKPVFKLAMKACPYRKDFFLALGDDQQKVNEQLAEWLSALEALVAILLAFLAVTCKDL